MEPNSAISTSIRAALSGILFLAALAGCGVYEWKRPGMSEDQRTLDTKECESYARSRYFRGMRFPYGSELDRRRVNGVRYETYRYPSRSETEFLLFAECMEKRGYRLVEKKEK